MHSLKEFASGGHQVIAFAKRNEISPTILSSVATVFELPMTTVSPHLPMTSPGRESDYTPRGFETPGYPLNKYPSSGERHELARVSHYTELPVQPSELPAPNVSTRSSVLESTPIDSADLVTQAEAFRLAELGVVDVSQLLALDAAQLPRDFLDSGFTPEQIDRYQSQAWLMICVPGLRGVDVRLLQACGVNEPEQLDTLPSRELFERLNRFLDSSEGIRFNSSRHEYQLDRLNAWYRGLDSTRTKWRSESGYSRRARRATRPESQRGEQQARFERREAYPKRDRFERTPRHERSRRRTRTGGYEPREPRIQSFADRSPSIRDSRSQATNPVNSALKFYLTS